MLQDQKVLAAKPDEKVENKFTNLHFFLEPRSGMARVPILNIPLICLARVFFGEPGPGRSPSGSRFISSIAIALLYNI